MKRIVLALVIVASSCSGGNNDPEDQKSGETIAEVTNVTVFKNVGELPDQGVWCVGDEAWTSTNHTFRRAAVVVRYPERDNHCGVQSR